MASQHGRQQMQEVPDVSNVLVDVGIRVVKANPKITTGYVIGLLVCILGTGFIPSDENVAKMDAGIRAAQRNLEEPLRKAERKLRITENAYYNSKGWFSCDSLCQTHRDKFDRATAEYKDLKYEFDSQMAEARSAVGIFSTYGVAEIRQVFWQNFAGGKAFAKRQTMWDALFIGIGGMARDESLIEYGLRLLMNMIFNFTLGLIGALIGFVFSIWGVLQSFGASLVSGGAFFVLATLGATAFVASWLIGLYAAAAGTVYVAGKAMINNARISGAQRQAHPNLRYQQYQQQRRKYD